MRTRFRATALLGVVLSAATGGGALARDHFVAVCSGGEEVPIPRPTRARGTAVLHVINDGTEIAYRLIVSNIHNVVAAHIHLAPEGMNGPVVAFLYGPAAPAGGRNDGPLAQGVIREGDLLGPLAGGPLSALIEAMRAGGTYVNVHTDDGVAPVDTGPGDFPGGEVRGQIQ
jgi:hypothetical protein